MFLPIVNQKAKQIGRGEFSKVYEIPSDSEYVYIIAKDWAKEMLCDSWVSDNPHLPEIEKLGDVGDSYLYKMRRYSKLTKQHTQAWQDYLKLRRIGKRYDFWQYMSRGSMDYYKYCYDLVNDERLPETIKDALENLLDYATNYDYNMMLEFTPRNLSVDSKGNLILRDVLFFPALLKRK